MIFAVLCAYAGGIAEANRLRSPVSGLARVSLTHGAVTSTAPALIGLAVGVAHDQAMAMAVPLVGECGDVGVRFGLEGFTRHPAVRVTSPRTIHRF